MKYDTTPKPIYLRAIQSDEWTVAGALSELIDNSFGPIRGNADTVWIAHDRTRRILTILDDGRGMEAVYRLFKLGDGAGRGIGDIGHFGSGGTMANIWLSRIAQVWTLRDGKVSSYKMNWSKQIASNDYFVVPDEWVEATEANTPAGLLDLGHGTMIEIYLLDGRSFYVQPMLSELTQTYAPGLRNGKRLVWQSMQRSKPDTSQELTLAEADAVVEDVVEFDGVLEIDGISLPLRGRVTLSDVPYSRSEIAIGFGHRVIMRTRDCYSSPDGSESFHGTGVSGWVDLGENWQGGFLSTLKTNFKNADVHAAVMAFIFERIRHLLEKTEKASQNMVLQDMEISLAAMMNPDNDARVSHLVSLIESLDKPEKPQGDGDEIETPDDAAEPSDEDTSENDTDDGEDEESPVSAMTNIEIVQMSDHDMEGILCSIATHGDFGVRALVNSDHEIVKDALKAAPKNKQTLMILIAHQLAGVLVDNQMMLKKTFKPRFVAMIERFSGRAKEQFVLRLLMDRVRWPVAS